MRKLFNSLFKSNEESQQANNTNETIEVKFYLTSDNNVNINCNWIDDDDTTANYLAKLLFGIHNGFYASKTADIFSKEIIQQTGNKDFLSKVILEWKKLNDAYQLEIDKTYKEPVVKPSNFNQNVKNDT